MQGGNGGGAEEAEAHGLAGFGVVAGRTGGGEGSVGMAVHDRVDGGDGAAGGVQGSVDAAGADMGVGVERGGFGYVAQAEKGFDVVGGVGEAELRFGGLGGGLAHEGGEIRVVEGGHHGAQAGGGFGVAGAGVVGEAGGMGEEGDAVHAGISSGRRGRRRMVKLRVSPSSEKARRSWPVSRQ